MKGKELGKLIYRNVNYWSVLTNTVLVVTALVAVVYVLDLMGYYFAWYFLPFFVLLSLLVGFGLMRKVEISRSCLLISYPIFGKSKVVDVSEFGRLKFCLDNIEDIDGRKSDYHELSLYLDKILIAKSQFQFEKEELRLFKNSRNLNIHWEVDEIVEDELRRKMLVYEKRIWVKAKNVAKRK